MFDNITIVEHKNTTHIQLGDVCYSIVWDHNVQRMSWIPLEGTAMWGYRYSKGVIINSFRDSDITNPR